MVDFVNSQLALDEFNSGRVHGAVPSPEGAVRHTYYFNVAPAAESTWPEHLSAALLAAGFSRDEFEATPTVIALHAPQDALLHSRLQALHAAVLDANEANYAALHPADAAIRADEMLRMDRVQAVKRLLAEDAPPTI